MSRSHVRGRDPRALGSDQHLPGRLQTAADCSPRQPILAVPARACWPTRSESIRKFAILDRQFSADVGELSPTLKLRRSVIEEHFAHEIESI